jgi:hypothetical protein
MTKCNKCGYENKDENNYCANCGSDLNPEANKEKQSTKMSPQSNLLLGTIAFIIIFSIIGAGIWWFTIQSTPGMSEATFTIVIESDTEWSGAIGGLGGSTTRSGSGSASFTIHSSIVSACIQKQTEWGYLSVKILKNGQLVEQQSTSAPYGVVTVSASS